MYNMHVRCTYELDHDHRTQVVGGKGIKIFCLILPSTRSHTRTHAYWKKVDFIALHFYQIHSRWFYIIAFEKDEEKRRIIECLTSFYSSLRHQMLAQLERWSFCYPNIPSNAFIQQASTGNFFKNVSIPNHLLMVL